MAGAGEKTPELVSAPRAMARRKVSPEAIAKARRVAEAAGIEIGLLSDKETSQSLEWLVSIIGLPEISFGLPKSETDLSLSSLWSELSFAKTFFVVNQKVRKEDALNKKRTKVAKQASRLAEMLTDEDVFCSLQDTVPPEMQLQEIEGSWHVHAFVSAIADGGQLQRVSATSIPDAIARPLGLGRLSAVANLIGSQLVRIYEKYAKEKVKFHRGRSGAAPVGGKFLAFAHQALSELDITLDGKPIAKETIVRAFTDAKRGSPRTHRVKRTAKLPPP
jgi:hypothetical protein